MTTEENALQDYKENTPYVKTYENGVLQNPILKKYVSPAPNRRERRGEFNQRPFNNSKSYPTIVTKIGVMAFVKYHPYIQRIGKKLIVH